MIVRKIDWQNFKNLASAGLNMQYIDRGTYYEIFLLSDYLRFMCKVLKDGESPQTEFEAIYKGLANRPHHYDLFSQTFTAAGFGSSRALLNRPRKYFSLFVKKSGAVLAWTVRLQVSHNSSDWTAIGTHTEATGDGIGLFVTTPSPALYVRSNCLSVSLGLGTEITATILGTE